jgi:hypothetical protein
MNKREYAISLGLAQPGRGRLSREAHAACLKAEADGYVFDEKPQPKPRTTVVSEEGETVVYSRPVQEQVRTIDKLTGYTEDGFKVGFTHCSTCGFHANFCKCPTIGLPHVVQVLDQTSIEMLGWKHDDTATVGSPDQESHQSN